MYTLFLARPRARFSLLPLLPFRVQASLALLPWLIVLASVLLSSAIAHAQTATPSPAGTDLHPLIDMIWAFLTPAFIALCAWLGGWVMWLWNGIVARNKITAGLAIDAAHRATLLAAVSRQAASLAADGQVAVDGMKLTVNQPALAVAVSAVQVAAPDALTHFGVTAESIRARIVDALPHVPAVALTQAAAAKPA